MKLLQDLATGIYNPYFSEKNVTLSRSALQKIWVFSALWGG